MSQTVDYSFVVRRQLQVELDKYRAALQKVATTDEPLTDEEQELVFGYHDE